jgi:hypothetical protein
MPDWEFVDEGDGLKEWEYLFEPGAVNVVEMVSPSPSWVNPDGNSVDVQVERYVLESSLQRSCRSEDDVRALLLDLGVSDVKASEWAAKLWLHARPAT